MKREVNKLVIGGVAVVLLLLVTTHLSEETHSKEGVKNSGLRKQVLVLNGQEIQAEVAETPEQRIKGLSYRKEPLKKGEGMLFIFEKDDNYRIWMKAMFFSIDILWITYEKQIAHIEHTVSPESYPSAFTSPEPVRYVLELPAGYAQEQGIKIGDTVDWQETHVQ